ncbi:AMP-binding protein [Kinneretia aquatilis]|nr:AMP-binding protein [Paucibacter aquatile]
MSFDDTLIAPSTRPRAVAPPQEHSISHELPEWPRARNFAEALRRNAAEQGDALVYQFWQTEDDQDEQLSHSQLAAWVGRYAQALRQLPGADEGRLQLVLALPQGRQFVVAFLACLAAGIVVVPTFPPRSPLQADRLRLVLRELGQAHVLCRRASLHEELAELRTDPELGATRWICVEELDQAPAASLAGLDPDPEALAMLQYTSGSTGRPKGVMLSQRNLVENSQLIQECFGHRKGHSRSVIWLPPYHDMGLVGGVLQPVHAGFATLLMPTSVLVRSPARWLQAVSEFSQGCSGGVSSGGPNFAFQLCVDKVRDRELQDLDLSGWRVAFCGAEPIHARCMDAFAQRFAAAGFKAEALFPCYGMAETTLMVSGKPLGQALGRRHLDARALARQQWLPQDAQLPHSQTVVSCGRPHASLELRIVEPSSRLARGEREIGEVWVRGSSVTHGYWQDPERSAQSFNQWLDGQGGWLRTGDLGALDQGELFITGRSKELLIVRGANYFPQDLEHEALSACPELINCRAVAFQHGPLGEEQVALALEVPRSAIDELDMQRRINARLSEKYGITLDTLLFIPRKTVRTTSSGKLQRVALKQEFIEGRLPIYLRIDARTEAIESQAAANTLPTRLDSAAAIESWLLLRIAQALRCTPAQLHPEDSFASMALDSVAALELLADLDSSHGIQLEPDALYRHNSPALLAQEIWRRTQLHPLAC